MSDLHELDQATRTAWLRLWRTDGIGPRAFFRLLHRHGSAQAVLRAMPELSRDGLPLRPPPESAVLVELDALDAMGAVLVAHPEPAYPAQLRTIHDPPPLLALRGRLEVVARPCVAIVGSRDASGNGRVLARQIAAELAAAGITVVSGLARGIDTAAHEGALEAGGATIAVIAAGPDIAYPPQNADLMERIARDGLIASERPPGAEPKARHFPRRNRLISGLSQAVLVIEASLRSGSLITARLALEQNREVLAVPGSPFDERHRGTNALLRDGAHLVETAADVLAVLPSRHSVARSRRPTSRPTSRPAQVAATFDVVTLPEDGSGNGLVELLGPDPLSIDELMRQCHLSAAEVQNLLLDLELSGRIERHHGNRVSLVQR